MKKTGLLAAMCFRTGANAADVLDTNKTKFKNGPDSPTPSRLTDNLLTLPPNTDSSRHKAVE